MESRRWLSLLLFSLLFLASSVVSQEDEEEEQEIFLEPNSFREPFYLARSTSINHWEFAGSTIVADKFIRLTPKEQSSKGWIWNVNPLKVKNWVIRLKFLVGGGGNKGGDGFALWYTKRPITGGGGVYGASGTWDGLGIFFDTYDNDQKGDNPSISAMMNNDAAVYNPDDDGTSNSLAKCLCPYRDRIITAVIRYVDGVLELITDVAGRSSPKACFSVEVELPRGYFLGLSGMTGQLVDNHDIFYLQTFKIKKAKMEEEEALVRDDEDMKPKKKTKIPRIEPEFQEEEEEAPVRPKQRNAIPARKEVEHEEHEEHEHEEPVPKKKQDKKKRPAHIHGAKGDDGHFNKILKGLADFEDRQQPEYVSHSSKQRDYPKIPDYQSTTKSVDQMHFLSEVHLQVSWLQEEQNATIKELEDIEKTMKEETAALKAQHKEFSHHLADVLKVLATKSDLEDLVSDDNENEQKKIQERMKKLSTDLESLRGTIRSENLQVSKSLKTFSESLKSIRSSMELITEDQKQLADSLQHATDELAHSVTKNTQFGISGYVLMLQVVVGVVAVGYQILKLGSSQFKSLPK